VSRLGRAGVRVGVVRANDTSWLMRKTRVLEVRRDQPEVSVATARGGTLFVETDGSVCPTGFAFKVHPLEGALSDHAVRDARERKCDLGYLRQP
jgi:hypothetical protein